MNKPSLMTTLSRYLLFGLVLPFLIQYLIFYRFTPNYNVKVFSAESFTKEYSHGVFRYRLVGKHLQLWVYNQLSSVKKIREMKENPSYANRLNYLDPDVNETFYFSYFVTAVFFSVLTALCLLLIFDLRPLFQMTNPQKILYTSFLMLFIGITHFVITPYDTLSYFLLTFGMLVFLKFIQSGKFFFYPLLCGVIIFATLNRESSLVILSFMATVYWGKNNLFDFRWIKKMIVPAACFIITYAALRMYLPGDHAFSDGIFLWANLDVTKISSLTGVFFVLIILYIIFNLIALSSIQQSTCTRGCTSEQARLNRSRTAASLAPMYLLRTSGPLTLTKRMPAAATAAATVCVLPHPGGPYSSTPVRSRSGALRSATIRLSHSQHP